MSRSADELLAELRGDLAPAEGDNRLIPLIVAGKAPRTVLAAFAAEQQRIIVSDRHSFLVLAARFPDPPAGEFFAGLSSGESMALARLPAFAAAAGLDDAASRAYRPRPGCQGYPAYVAWLALNGSAADVVAALVANFAAWGGYCATVARALRDRYGFDDEACGFLDFFATPAPQVERQAAAVVQAALDAGQPVAAAREYGRLLQGYELMFWNTLADLAA